MSAQPLAARKRDRRSDYAATWRAFRTAMRLGWQTEANWADPLLFFIYSVAKPVGAAAILVFMVDIISGGRADPGIRVFVVVGSALWSFVVAGIAGLAWSVLDDRERYRMLKYLYVSPNSLLVLLLGRGAARIGIGAFGALITLLIGALVLGVPFDVLRVDWPLALIAMALGLASILGLGLILAATVMQTRQDSWSYPEAVAGALFLLVGAVFPLLVLPAPIQVVGLLTPLTWWLEGIRHALFPGILSGVGGAGSVYADWTGRLMPSTAEIVLVLAASTAVVLGIGVAFFRWSERRAKEKGLFDQITGS
ncbi:MAG TPA: ABC transporter permease [Candidatus Limnocylindrales bacterium]|jgi:ABC-2 type transport system permease protein|nr:ABC transporter permease [Candidatus Limnocylindrales bacterium]